VAAWLRHCQNGLDAMRRPGAKMVFTSQRHTPSRALMPFFGGRMPA
jgi:hypothetical protein